MSVDPGRSTGWAAFGSDKRLIAAGPGVPPFDPDILVAEIPKVYPGQPAGKANGLVVLGIELGAVLSQSRGRLATWLVEPHQWKGSLHKSVHQRRALLTLPAECRTKIAGLDLLESRLYSEPAKAVNLPASDILDAVLLGRWSCVNLGVGRLVDWA